MPKRSRQTALTTKDGSCAGRGGRIAPVIDDFNVALMPELAKDIAPTELVAVEHLLGLALLDLLKQRDHDSVEALYLEVVDVKT